MRILVFEYITGGGLANMAISPSLLCEGDLMLNALLADLSAVAGVEIVTMRDRRLDPLATLDKVHNVESENQLRGIWKSLLQEVDAVWPIAPESHGILERLSTDVLEAGSILLNSRPVAVRTAASKRRTAQLFSEHGIPVVPTYTLHGDLPPSVQKWVVKPDDGVGCDGVRLLDGYGPACNSLHGLQEGDDYIAQPYIEGVATSLSMLCREGEACLLSTNEQRVSLVDGGFCLQGCVVGASRDQRESYACLAGEIAAALPGLWGYTGVDLIESATGPRVLEVNPRLTTSYVGLRRSLGVNPAALVLDLLHSAKPLALSSSGTRPVHIELENACVG